MSGEIRFRNVLKNQENSGIYSESEERKKRAIIPGYSALRLTDFKQNERSDQPSTYKDELKTGKRRRKKKKALWLIK